MKKLLHGIITIVGILAVSVLIAGVLIAIFKPIPAPPVETEEEKAERIQELEEVQELCNTQAWNKTKEYYGEHNMYGASVAEVEIIREKKTRVF